MAWRSCISAVVLIVVVAVAAFIRIFESNAQRLEYVNSCVNSSVNLMDYKFVWLGVGEALCRIGYDIGYYFGVVVGIDFIVCVREAYARVFAPANAVIEMETAVPEVEVLTAPVATAPPPRANAGAAPNTALPHALTEQAAVDPLVAFAYALAAGDAIPNIEVLPLRSPRGPVPAVNNLAVRETAAERLAELREKRRLDAGAAHRR